MRDCFNELNLPNVEPYVDVIGAWLTPLLTPIFQLPSREPPPLFKRTGFPVLPGGNSAVGTFLGCPLGASVLVTPGLPVGAVGSAPGASALVMSASCGLGGCECALPMPDALAAARGSGLLWLTRDDRPKEARNELGVADRKFVKLQSPQASALI